MSQAVRDESESRLLARAQAYDADALTELYRRHADGLFRYIYFRIRDRAAAEDLVGDVFVKAIEDLPGYREIGRPFEAWLYAIARARVIDYYRRQSVRRTAVLNEHLLAAPEEQPDQQLIERDDAQRARAALDHLTEEQQQVVSLRFYVGRSLAEVAALMGKTEGSVKSLQHRALASLRRMLEHEHE
jgi:RNA polymerase sigma-70 factor (ECF subfamily)